MRNLFAILITFLCVQYAVAQKTSIYIVRHGEKSIENPSDRDPALSSEGMERAQALLKILKDKNVSAIFSTNYKRTKSTAQPLADNNKLIIETYNPGEAKALAERIKVNYKGKTVLLVGHSNTVLELTEAFGAIRPLKALTDNDYDNLFLVTIDGTEIKAVSEKFGKAHHEGS